MIWPPKTGNMDETISITNLQSTVKPANGSTDNLSSHKIQNNGNAIDGGSSQPTNQLSSEPRQRKSSTHLAPKMGDKDNEYSEPLTISQDTSPSKKTATNNGGCPASERVVYDVEHLATFSTNSGHETTSNKSNNAPGNKSVATGISASANDESNNHDNTDTHGEKSTGFDGPDQAGELNLQQQASVETTPKVALQRLFELEKQSGIWTQHMQIELRDDFMFIIDCETNSVVERFNKNCVTKAEAFNHYNDIYNNIVVFIIKQLTSSSPGRETSDTTSLDTSNDNQSDKTQLANSNPGQSDKDCDYKSGELHIFQCVSHQAQELVKNILDWKSRTISSDKTTTGAMNFPDKTKGLSKRERSSEGKNKANGSPKGALISKSDSRQSIINQSNKFKNEKPTLMPLAISGSSPSSSGKPMVTMATCSSSSENSPIVNVNVKETVQVFNQIAALREKGNSKPTSPTNHSRPLSDNLRAHSPSSAGPPSGSGSSGSDAAPANSNSPSGQLYKQRSIRATLAPKSTASSTGSGGGSTDPPHGGLRMESCLASSSSGGSSSGSTSNQNNQQRQQSEMVADHKIRQSLANGGSSSSSARSSLGGKGSTQGTNGHYQYQHQPQSHRESTKSASRGGQMIQVDGPKAHSSPHSQLDQISTNESYVSVLNHCFDDIEKFIIRLQQSMTASHELQMKKKLAKRAAEAAQLNGKTVAREEPVYGQPNGAKVNGNKQPANGSSTISGAELAALSAKAREPSEEDYFEIMSKFKLAFNLLAKLKGCIHEPNAPELVHFLFTPLAIIIESARNASPPIDPTLVGIPYLNQDALDLLSNCCTSKESDMWNSLGPNWTQTIDTNLLKASRLPSSFQPIFSDGWAPIIRELELIGLTAPSSHIDPEESHHSRRSLELRRNAHSTPYFLDDSMSNYPVTEQRRYGPLPRSGKLHGKEPKRHRDASLNHRLMLNHSALDVAHPSYSSHQLNSVPYDYPHDEALLPPELDLKHPMGKLGTAKQLPPHLRMGNLRSSRPELGAEAQRARRLRQSARQNYGYGIDPQAAYQTGQYPPMSLPRSSHPDDDDQLEYLGPSSGQLNYSDDYTEVQDPYMRNEPRVRMNPATQGRSRIDASHARHRRSASTGRQPPSAMPKSNHLLYPVAPQSYDYLGEADHEAMLLDLGPAQTEWFYELQARGAMTIRVLFTRNANNEKELSVRRGEILEVLDDTRKWWRARNIDLQEAHVPHTIVAIMEGYQTLDELLTSNQGNLPLDKQSSLKDRYARRDIHENHANYEQNHWQIPDDKRSSTAATGAFRYF